MGSPDPPVNVVVHPSTGEPIPVDTVYDGVENGVHVWRVATPERMPVDIAKITVDVLPAHTAIRFDIGGDPVLFDPDERR